MTRTPKSINLTPMTKPIVVEPTTTTEVVVASPMQPVVLTIGNQGESTQMAIAEATKKVTSIAKTSDMDELGQLLGETLTAAKGYDPTSMKGKGGILGFLKGKVEGIKQRYEKVDGTVTRLVAQIDQRITLFTGRVGDLAQIAQQNRAYHDSLNGDIEHLQAGVAYMEANIPAIDPDDPFSAQKVQDWQRTIDWARKRADDLRRAQIVSQQQDAQINLMAQNSQALAQKFKDLKVTTLPLLQQSFTLYIINTEQTKGAAMADSIDNLSNETLKKNAKALGHNTTAIQTSLGRSNFSLEAITANHDAVLKALDDIERIRAETKARLQQEAPLLEQKSRELAERLARPQPALTRS